MPFTHVALVGLMGSGKSAVAEIVGARLGLALVDVDDEITRLTGRSVRDLWEQGGEAAYRPLERAIVLEALTPGPGKVLAAPGGVVIDPEAEEALAQPHVAVVYLRAAPETLAERVRADDQPRPLLTPDPLERLRDMHDRRDHRYRALGQLTEDVEGRSPQQLAEAVLDAFAVDLAGLGPPTARKRSASSDADHRRRGRADHD
jgi:shikimate kinase